MSVMLGYGMAVILVEKGKDFPIRKYRILLQKAIHDNIGGKWPKVLKCTTCSSFWTTLIADLIIFILAALHGYFYFFFPFSGFITAGITFTIVEYLNSIDKKQNINLMIGEDKGE